MTSKMGETRRKYKYEHHFYLEELFSVEYICKAQKETIEIVKRYIDKVAIRSLEEDGELDEEELEVREYNYYCTDLLQTVSTRGALSRYEVELELRHQLNNMELTSENILAMLVTRLYSPIEFPFDNDYDALEKDEVESVIRNEIIDLLNREYLEVPEVVKSNVLQIIQLIANEFDLSDGLISKEEYHSVVEWYTSPNKIFTD